MQFGEIVEGSVVKVYGSDTCLVWGNFSRSIPIDTPFLLQPSGASTHRVLVGDGFGSTTDYGIGPIVVHIKDIKECSALRVAKIFAHQLERKDLRLLEHDVHRQLVKHNRQIESDYLTIRGYLNALIDSGRIEHLKKDGVISRSVACNASLQTVIRDRLRFIATCIDRKFYFKRSPEMDAKFLDALNVAITSVARAHRLVKTHNIPLPLELTCTFQ